MSVLKTTQETERIYLPSTAHLDKTSPEADWVDMVVGEMLAGDMLGVDPTDEIGSAYRILSHRIKGWSFTDEALVTLPITIDNIQFMKRDDVFFLAARVMEDASVAPASLTTDQKKS